MTVDPFTAPTGAFLSAVGLELQPVDAADVAAQGVRGSLVVDERHHTPWGVVHGGVWATVVETVASVGASLAVAEQGQFAVGVDNLTDFHRPVVSGRLDVVGTPVQIGRTLQTWDVTLTDERGKLVARGRVRLANQPLP